MQTEFYEGDARGVAEHDWLSSRFSFSFADYYNPDRLGFGALRVLNDDKIAAGKGFGMHPHQNMEIISIPLIGELMHKDDLGNEITIGPDQVQVMSAGSGVTHSEINPSKTVDGQFLQLWILTRSANITPAHDHSTFPSADQEGNFVTLVQPDTAKGAALKISSDAYISRGRFEPNTTNTYKIKKPGNGAYVFLIDGEVTIDDHDLSPRDALGIIEVKSFKIKTSTKSDILIIEVPVE